MAKNQVDHSYCYRFFYSRQEIASFIAHLDLMRLFQRALRRADLPLVYTQGFNPRPIMEFALPIGVGLEARFEPFEILLADKLTVDSVKERVNQKLPRGIFIEKVELITAKHKGLMSLVEAAIYQLEAEGLGKAVLATYDDPKIPLLASRSRKGKTRQYDLRDYVMELEVLSDQRVRFKAKAGSSENLRPDLFLAAYVNLGLLSEEQALDAIMIRESVELKGGTLK